MTASTEAAAAAAITAACTQLHLPTVRAEADGLADAAARDAMSHRGYLAELLAAEVDARHQRRVDRRLKEARFPRHRRLADFDVDASAVDAATLGTLAGTAWLDHGRPLVLLGDSGRG